MSEDPAGLIERLKMEFGVSDAAIFGPSIIVPNSSYRPEWTDILGKAGFKVFSGEKYGRVAWIIPLEKRCGVEVKHAEMEKPKSGITGPLD